MVLSFSAAIFPRQDEVFNPSGVNQSAAADSAALYYVMKADLLNAASVAIPNQQILVNMVSRRVRQLILGHRPLVEFSPGLGFADLALSEIGEGKLSYESTFGKDEKDALARVIPFPGTTVSKKKAA